MISLCHALEIPLKVQYGLPVLGSTAANGIAMGRGAGRPCSLALMSIVLSVLHGITLELRLIQYFHWILHAVWAV